MARHIPHSDHGTVLQRDQAALIANPDGSLSLLMPDWAGDEVPSRSARLLIAMAVRADDPEWVEEMLDFLQEQKRRG